MQIKEIKVGDKIKFWYRYEEKAPTIKQGYVYLITDQAVCVSEGVNVGGSQMWACNPRDVISVFVEQEQIVEQPLTFEFLVQEAEMNYSVRACPSAYMGGCGKFTDSDGHARWEEHLRLPWDKRLGDLGMHGKYKVTIEKIP
jgi:hypothetical protein